MRTAALLLVATVFARCSSPKLESTSPPDHFERKKQCADRFNQFNRELLVDDVAPYTTSHLKELFYSPSLNTCVAAFLTTYENGAPGSPNVAYLLQDALSRKVLFDLTIRDDSAAEEKWKTKREALQH